MSARESRWLVGTDEFVSGELQLRSRELAAKNRVAPLAVTEGRNSRSSTRVVPWESILPLDRAAFYI